MARQVSVTTETRHKKRWVGTFLARKLYDVARGNARWQRLDGSLGSGGNDSMRVVGAGQIEGVAAKYIHIYPEDCPSLNYASPTKIRRLYMSDLMTVVTELNELQLADYRDYLDRERFTSPWTLNRGKRRMDKNRDVPQSACEVIYRLTGKLHLPRADELKS